MRRTQHILRILRMKRIKGLYKGSTAERLLRLFILLALLSGIAAVLLQFLAVRRFGWEPTVYRERHEVDFNPRLSINTSNMPLEVFAHDGEKIIIEYTGETALLINEDSDFLRISREEDFKISLFSRDMLNYKMTVWLPRKAFREIKLSTVSADISAQELTAESFAASSRSGNVTLRDVRGIISVNTRFGDVELVFDEFSEPCAVETDAGNVSVLMPGSFGVRLDYFTDGGKFTSDFFGREFKNHKGVLYMVSGANPVHFTVRTNSGNLVFHKRIIYIE